MAAETGEAAALGGVALLEALRPPRGWFTESAFGTTYSLELPVALASLIALSGTASETRDYTRHAAFRALQTLKGRVRIVAQHGRIAAPSPSKHGALHLLDDFVSGAACDEKIRSFHPKLWLVHWADKHGELPSRWRLVVGSRNLTSAAAWDLGAVVDGAEDGAGTVLDDLPAFLRTVSELAGVAEFLKRFRSVNSVRWDLPRGARSIRFGFHGSKPLAWDETALAQVAKGARRVLAISPFLDSEAVTEFARRFRVEPPLAEPSVRIIGGLHDLEKVSTSQKGSRALAACADVRGAVTANESTRPNEPEPESNVQAADVREADLGLHAKAIVVDYSRDDASVLFGSPNLTRRGWVGGNVEAWILLRGRAALAEPLWAWASRFPQFSLPPVEALQETIEERLEKFADSVRFTLAGAEIVLREPGSGDAILTASTAIPFPPADIAVELTVARLSTLEPPHLWPAGSTTMRLSACTQGERTRLLRFCITMRVNDVKLARTWVQEVRLDPPLDASKRDAEAMAAALGPAGFLAYLRGLVDPAADDFDGSDSSTRVAGEKGEGASVPIDESLSLEWLLRAFARCGPSGVEELRDRLSKAIFGYRSAVGGQADDSLDHLWTAWDALDGALREPDGPR